MYLEPLFRPKPDPLEAQAERRGDVRMNLPKPDEASDTLFRRRCEHVHPGKLEDSNILDAYEVQFSSSETSASRAVSFLVS
jgi:hypothetical protein